jgi:hypothetical protein
LGALLFFGSAAVILPKQKIIELTKTDFKTKLDTFIFSSHRFFVIFNSVRLSREKPIIDGTRI